MSDTTPKLTPELVLMAISGGLMDGALDSIRSAISVRTEVIAKNKAGSMLPGDRFLVKDVSPKKWEGLEVEYVRREGRDNQWLVCLLSERDARFIKNYNMPGEMPRMFREVRFRESHVGTFVRHQMTAG